MKISSSESFLRSLGTLYTYISNDISKRPRSFKIGIFTIFLVVTFLVFLQTALSITPILFIKLAEDSAGEGDLIMTPSFNGLASTHNSGLPFSGINLTDLNLHLRDLEEIDAIYPRWTVPVSISNPYHPDKEYKMLALIIDSKFERLNGVGRTLDLQDLGPKECWISQTAFKLINTYGNIMTSNVDFR